MESRIFEDAEVRLFLVVGFLRAAIYPSLFCGVMHCLAETEFVTFPWRLTVSRRILSVRYHGMFPSIPISRWRLHNEAAQHYSSMVERGGCKRLAS